MELVQVLLEKQEERLEEERRAEEAKRTARGFGMFGGADIVATFNGQVIGELQSISYEVERERAPTYELGTEPVFGRTSGFEGSMEMSNAIVDEGAEFLREVYAQFGIEEVEVVSEEREYSPSDAATFTVETFTPEPYDVIGLTDGAMSSWLVSLLDRELSMSIGVLDESNLYQNRAARRKKERTTTAHNNQLRQMIGGRNHWS